MKKLPAIILTLALLLTALSLTACGGTSLDLKDYTTVEFTGVDGDATAKISFDFAAFEEAYSAANGSSDPFSQKAFENSAKLMSFEDSLDYEVTPSEGLSNGDEVEVTFTYSKDAAQKAGLSLKNTSYKLTVEELTEAIVIDAFDPAVFNTDTGVMITYNGIAPNGSLSISNKVEKSNPISQVTYKADSDGVAYGDTITITASLPKTAEDEGYVLKEETYEYPLKDVDHLLTGTDELTADDKSALKTKYETIIKGLDREHYYDADGTWYAIIGGVVKNPRIGDIYLLKKNDGTYENKAFVSVYADIEGDGEDPNCSNSIAYYTVEDFYIKADGSLNYNAQDYATDFYATEDVANKQYWKDYTAEYNIEKVSFD
ncbi:MAG: hypothetical protein IJV48_07530 [Ruminococcus sp.]|nr:hypothetical protein [Ruminococcus sp.]